MKSVLNSEVFILALYSPGAFQTAMAFSVVCFVLWI